MCASRSRSALRRRRALLVLIALHVLFWCPLFALNLLDVGPLHSTRYPYRALTIFGLSSSLCAPFAVLHFLGLDAARVAAACRRRVRVGRRAAHRHARGYREPQADDAERDAEASAEHVDVEMRANPNPHFATSSPSPSAAPAARRATSSLCTPIAGPLGNYRPHALTASQQFAGHQLVNRAACSLVGAAAAGSLPESSRQRLRPRSAPTRVALEAYGSCLEVADEVIQMDANRAFVSSTDPFASFHCLSAFRPIPEAAVNGSGPLHLLPVTCASDRCQTPSASECLKSVSVSDADVGEERILLKRASRLHTSSPRQSERATSSAAAATAASVSAGRSKGGRVRRRQSSHDRQQSGPSLRSRAAAADTEDALDSSGFGPTSTSTWWSQPALRVQLLRDVRSAQEQRAYVWANAQAAAHCRGTLPAAATIGRESTPPPAEATPHTQPFSLFAV